MIDKNKIKQFWEDRGAKYDKPTEEMANLEANPELQAMKIRQEKALVLPRLKLHKNMDILDLGAGYGQWSMRFAPLVNSVTAVEYASSMLRGGILEAERRHLDNIQFIHSAAEDFRPVRQYQLVFISGLFMYLDDEQANRVANLAKSALAPGGHVFLRESVSLLGRKYVIDDRWSEASQANYSANYRLSEEFITMFNGLKLMEEGDFFPPGSPLNKWRETRLRFFLFCKVDLA